jgi:hypothetical protein
LRPIAATGALQDFYPADVRFRVISGPSGQSHTIGHVCFASKSDRRNQNVIRRRFVPKAGMAEL